MSGVQTLTVAPEDAEIRLDRWFKRHFPALGHGRLEKLLRTGQVRLDGKRADAGDRVATGQRIRVPPLPDAPPPETKPSRPPPSAADARLLQDHVLYRDDDIIVIDKPEGLAVQGGTGTTRHLDGLLDALRFGAKERPRLVHRLDKDTSGVLVLARSARAAARLGAAFRGKTVRKVYWAIVVGAPKPRQGKIDQPLAKQGSPARERVAADDAEGDRALTYYRTTARAGDRFAWLALEPVTGRTHQLRVHCLALGTPILGDGKYGGAAAHPASLPQAKKLHLHARAIALPSAGGKTLTVTAPLPPHMRASWDFFGFEESSERDPFAELAPAEKRR
jgi:23S rRNA pseudouridine955/2504/2580 synthase